MKTKLLPLYSTTLLYFLYYVISMVKFDVQILTVAITYDFLLLLFINYLIFAISRKFWLFLIIQTIIMGILYVGNAVKISFFGGPIMPDDVFALRSLLLILEGWRFFAAAIPLAALLGLLLFNFSMRRWSSYVACSVIILFVMTVVYKPNMILDPIDKYTGNSVWDQRSNYVWHGATLYSLQETTRFFSLIDNPPTIDDAEIAANNLLDNTVKSVSDEPFLARNVHIVLLESFWDASNLKKAHYNQNPLSAEFRKLWKSAGYSHALTPVFGGYTANSEFEVLCGFPINKDNVKFERQLTNEVPCLPHILGDKGYKTVVSHPNVPVFWNRINAYRNIGFQTYYSKDDFVLDDMNQEFLSDSSLYRQVLEKIGNDLNTKQPIVDYIVTYFGHWNYPLSESRPAKITSTSPVEEVTSYANTVYYKSHELMGFINQLKKQDPTGIIVVFGDHLPFLGENFAGYVDSGVLTANRSDFSTDMFKFYVSTPLIIIDGEKGVLSVGDLPLYQVPKLILNLLHYNEPSIMDYTVQSVNKYTRPLPGLHFSLLNKGEVELCKDLPLSDSCLATNRWLQDVLIVSNDLFIGKQYTRPKHSEPIK